MVHIGQIGDHWGIFATENLWWLLWFEYDVNEPAGLITLYTPQPHLPPQNTPQAMGQDVLDTFTHSPGRYLLKIHSNVESGPKTIQFNIYSKFKSEIFIQ